MEKLYKLPVKFIPFFFLLFFVTKIKSQNTQNCYIVIDSITVEGNVKTKRSVIIREILFKEKDSILCSNFENLKTKSRENLLNMPLFNFVYIDSSTIAGNHKKINIRVEERWYTWPIFAMDPADRNMSVWLQNKDITRINISMGVERYNFLGLNQKLRIRTVFGYEQNFSISYIDAYVGKKRQHSFSFFAGSTYGRSLDYDVKDNKLQSVKLYNNYAIKYSDAAIAYKYRKKIYDSQVFFIRYKQYSIADTIFRLNPQFLNGKDKKVSFLNFEYYFRYNKKDSRSYPLVGKEFIFNINQFGPGIISDNINQLSFKIQYSQYFKIIETIYFAGKISGKTTFGNKDGFIFRQALGYVDVLRGYEYYVINANDFGLMNNDLKFRILKPNVYELKIKRLSKCPKINTAYNKFNKIPYALYLNIFFDLAYANDRSKQYYETGNDFVNTHLYSYGAGINLVTYYDVVLRLEVARNKKKEIGFIINFSAPF